MTSIAQLLKLSSIKHSQKTAISFLRNNQLETRLSFLDLDRDSNRMANQFLDMGIGRLDHVVFLLDKSPVFVVAYIALQKIGAVCIPLNPGFKESELTYLLNDASPSLAVVEKKLAGLIRRIDPHLALLEIDSTIPPQDSGLFSSFSDSLETPGPVATDPGLIIYTSGTTGNPKGALLTQKNLVHDATNIIGIWEISDRDALCHALPLFHVHGLCFALHTALISGSHVILLDRFNPETAVDLLKEKSGELACSVFMGVPTMYLGLIHAIGNRALSFDHLRLLTSGSAPLPVPDFEKIRQVFGKEPVEREGMSETGINFSNPLHGEKKPGSVGIALPGLDVRIVDPETTLDVEPGEVGEFWLKSDSITPGYWKKPEETARAFSQGWFKTGDLGRRDADGYYYLTDRLKNLIITGGENVSPSEIEAVINRIDGVVESSVVGVPDKKWGEKVVAAMVKAHGTMDLEDEVKSACKKYLLDWKCPKQFIFLEKLPRNTMGKILREEIKKLF